MKRRGWNVLAALGLVGTGYLLGIAKPALVASAQQAKPVIPEPPSEDVMLAVEKAMREMDAALRLLKNGKHYVPAIEGMNAFAITAAFAGASIDAISALEEGRGVDPETFAGLYAGMAVKEVGEKLDVDDQGRLLYDGKLIRMYPKTQLRQLFEARHARLVGEAELKKQQEKEKQEAAKEKPEANEKKPETDEKKPE